ncbi:microcephalin isoform X2 [Polypterus senegalus]|uniref:microcephalin isoform X2 n=1 Tax=Polypterus senegalus TaxID=55291 RepID=UPI0019641AE9|nr:microcephalin isoform X2 [Polypterus senegalus]
MLRELRGPRVVAFVDVWSSKKNENYSKVFAEQLASLGARVSKTFNKQVTHVVFKDGHDSTWKKAKKSGMKLVSVLWVESCQESGRHVDEALYPAVNENERLITAPKKRTHRCMQPKTLEERTPENDWRLKRKLEQMMKKLVSEKASTVDSVLCFDADGSVAYSPRPLVLQTGDYMEQRLRDMKEKRENLSPTASQMVDTPWSSLSPKQLPGRPEVLPDDEPSLALGDLDSSFHELFSFSKKSIKQLTSNARSGAIDPSSPQLTTPPSTSSSHTGASRTSPLASGRKAGKPKRSARRSQREVGAASSPPLPGAGVTQNGGLQGLDEQPVKDRVMPLSLHTLDEGGIDAEKPTLVCKQRANGGRNMFSAELEVDICVPRGALPLLMETPKKPVSALPTKDDEPFEDYFSPLNGKDCRVKRISLAGADSECFAFPPLERLPLREKRKRSTRNSGETTVATKRKRSQASGAGDQTAPQTAPGDLGQKGAPRRKAETPSVSAPGGPSLPVCEKPASARCHMSETDAFSDILEGTTSTAGGTSPERPPPDMLCPSGRLDRDAVPSDVKDDDGSENCRGGSEKTMKTDRARKPKRTLVMTSMPSEKQSLVIQLVQSLGGFSIVDQVCESTTHVVAGCPRRTLNVLLGMARGCWILSFEWVIWCLERGQWIPEEPYELADHFPAAPICRLQRHLSAGEYQQNLFADFPAIFISASCQPPAEQMAELILLYGGKVCKTIRQAGLCIGGYKGKTPLGTRVLSEQWILDCITQHKKLPWDEYVLP